MKKVLYTSLSAIGLLLSTLTSTAQSVGIGTTTPNASARLDITATNKGLLIPNVNLTGPNDNTTIASPAKGLLVWNTNSIMGEGYYYNSVTPASPVWLKLSTGSGAAGWALTGNAGTDTAVNFLGTTDAMPLHFKINNQFSGHLGPDNIYFGRNSGELSDPATAYSNIAIGFQSQVYNTIGFDNVSVGDFTLYNTDDYLEGTFGAGVGGGNTAVGSWALTDNADGIYNTAVGSYSNAYYNADNPDAISTSGFFNTAIGSFALCYDTTNLVDVENSTAIGYGATADVSNMVRVGDDFVEQIGGFVEWSTLSDGRFKKDIRKDGGGLDFIMNLRPVNYHYDFSKMNNNRIEQLRSKIAAYKIKKGKGEKVTAENAKAIANDTRMLKLLTSDKHKNKISKNENRVFNGLIAQEVEAAANTAGYEFSGIVKPTNSNGRYALRYATFVVPLIESVQQQQKTIEAQNKKIDDLTKRLEKLELLSK